ncbi:MAG: hypothetical protein ABFC21_09005 [Rectinema sp.]
MKNRFMKRFRFECWHVAYRSHIQNIEQNKASFIIIPNTFRYWAADPFIMFYDNKYYVFAELYDRLRLKGRIGYCILSDNGRLLSGWKIIISSKDHLSFPYLIKKGNKIILMPESSKENQLRLYEPTSFPNIWRISTVLIDGEKLVDSIFLNEELLLTYDNFSSPRKVILYKRQRNNEFRILLKVDDINLRLRPAGKAFNSGGKLIVPLQNCFDEYGKSILLTEIKYDDNNNILEIKNIYEISKDTIKISNFNNLIIGIHTYNFDNIIEVIDIKTRKFNLLNLIGLALKLDK